MKILVAEDSKFQASILLDMLHSQGWEVVLAKNGEEAMGQLDEFSPDIILSDLEMPVLDGYGFCKQVKAGPFKKIPFILLSAQGELDQKLKGFEIGADDYLIKPVHERELYARVRSFQRIKEYQDQLQEALEQQKLLLDEQKMISEKLEKAYQQQMEELEQAKQTQSIILPQELPEMPGFRVVSKYTPMNEIGGDFYDILKLKQKRLGIFVGDVTGHGIPAALISFMASSAFKTFCGTGVTPETTMQLLNTFLHEKIEEGKFVSAWYGIYDLRTRVLAYTSAGHPPGYVVRSKTEEIFPLNTSAMALGLFPSDMNNFQSDWFQLESGDKLLIYTDGLYEITNAEDQLFGDKRLQNYLLDMGHLPVEKWVEAVYDHVLTYAGDNGFNDDITLVGLQIVDKD